MVLAWKNDQRLAASMFFRDRFRLSLLVTHFRKGQHECQHGNQQTNSLVSVRNIRCARHQPLRRITAPAGR